MISNKKRILLLMCLLSVALLILATGGICAKKAKPVILERDCVERIVGFLDYALAVRYTVRNDGAAGYVTVVATVTNSGRYQQEVRFYLYKGQTKSGELIFTKPTIWERYTYSVTAHAR